MSEWKEYRLGDLGTVITGKTPSAHNPEDWVKIGKNSRPDMRSKGSCTFINLEP